MMKTKTCAVSGCKKAVHARGICQAHYRKMARGGELTPLRNEPAMERSKGIYSRISEQKYEQFERVASERNTSIYDVAGRVLEKWNGKL